jgi:hypothetical protein
MAEALVLEARQWRFKSSRRDHRGGKMKLTPGAKKRVLKQLEEMRQQVTQDYGRDELTWKYHDLGTQILNSFAYTEGHEADK